VNHGFDILGAELPARPLPVKRTMLALTAGVVGAVLVKKHPVLAFLGTAAAASNVHAVISGERTMKQAIQRMGRHVVATVGALAVPKYPAMGYVAGAVGADLFIDGEGGGIIEEFTDYEGIRSTLRGEVIDAEFTEIKSPGVALQKAGT
jgi:hypothetical protein